MWKMRAEWAPENTFDEVTVYDEYRGESSGKIAKESIAAVKLVA